MIKKRILWIILAVLGGAILLQPLMFAQAADEKPYSVSINSPVAFPVDI